MSTDPDQIRQDIERTQDEMSGNVDALTSRVGAMADKYNPRKAVGHRVNRIRDTFGRARHKVMGTAESVGQTTSGKAGQAQDRATHAAAEARHKIGSAPDKARDRATHAAAEARHKIGSAPDKAQERIEGSPLAAGLIAFGAGMLVSSLLPASQAERRAVGRVKDVAGQHSDQVKQELRGAGQQMREGLREPAQHAAESVKSTAGQAASQVRNEGQRAARDVKEQAQQAGRNVQSQPR
jgi:ElaB/YqjD/DUF883 family membrane-anchored ribosome-binding protein